jgi:hypothetical protein
MRYQKFGIYLRLLFLIAQARVLFKYYEFLSVKYIESIIMVLISFLLDVELN